MPAGGGCVSRCCTSAYRGTPVPSAVEMRFATLLGPSCYGAGAPAAACSSGWVSMVAVPSTAVVRVLAVSYVYPALGPAKGVDDGGHWY